MSHSGALAVAAVPALATPMFNAGAAFFAIMAIIVSRQMYLPDGLATSKFWFYVFLILFSFCSLPMFSLILAHTNDYIPKEKFVAAGAGLQFVFGLGAMSGPFYVRFLWI